MTPQLSQDISTVPAMIGASREVLRMKDFAERAGRTHHTIFLQGETGVGKDRLAALTHWSGRRDLPFVTVDCGAIPETLVETTLFGYVPGAFTDARANKAGLVQEAGDGTLFFDEVENMSPLMQGKVLRLLQSRTFHQVGGSKEMTMSARVIAATNTDIQEAVRTGKMRRDLFGRLNVIPFRLAPLRDRREDIPVLAQYFLDRECQTYGFTKSFSAEARVALMENDWPENVRGLQHAVERAAFLADEDEIKIEHLDLSDHILVGGGSTAGAKDGKSSSEAFTLTFNPGMPLPAWKDLFNTAKGQLAREALKQSEGQLKGAARRIQVTYKTIINWANEDPNLKEFVRSLRGW